MHEFSSTSWARQIYSAGPILHDHEEVLIFYSRTFRPKSFGLNLNFISASESFYWLLHQEGGGDSPAVYNVSISMG